MRRRRRRCLCSGTLSPQLVLRTLPHADRQLLPPTTAHAARTNTQRAWHYQVLDTRTISSKDGPERHR